MKDVPKLKNKEEAKGSMKEWATFHEDFPQKMKAGDRGEGESITWLLQSIHKDLVKTLERDPRGTQSGSLNSCMELLRELFVGKDWREKGVNLYKSFRRKWSWEPKEFEREFASVCEAVGYPLRWEKEDELSYRPRSKMKEMFTALEKDMLGKKGVDFLHDPWAVVWEEMDNIYTDSFSRNLLLLERVLAAKEASKGKESSKPKTDQNHRGAGRGGRGNGGRGGNGRRRGGNTGRGGGNGRGSGENGGGASGTNERECFKCHSTGHLASECTDFSCYCCGDKGHMAKECEYKEHGRVCYNCKKPNHDKKSCRKEGGGALNFTVKMETNNVDDDDDDDDEDIPLSQLKRKAPAPPKKQVPSKKAEESSDDDDDDEDIPLSQLQRKIPPKKAPAKKAPAKKAPAKKAPVKKSPARKAKVIESDDDDDDDDDDEDIPLSQLRRKKSTPAQSKEVEEDEDSDDPIEQLANLKKTSRRRSKR